jgi:FKBP-type peptidyl-prolyl cis-trans isomerase 2
MGPVNVKVISVNEDTVTLDANHPLAGKKLIFDLEVIEIAE